MNRSGSHQTGSKRLSPLKQAEFAAFRLVTRQVGVLKPHSSPGMSANRTCSVQYPLHWLPLATKPVSVTIAGGGLICPGAARNQSPEATDIALAYSEANSSLSGYCSLNSRNNLCARAFCFSRRAGTARKSFSQGRRERPFSLVL